MIEKRLERKGGPSTTKEKEDLWPTKKKILKNSSDRTQYRGGGGADEKGIISASEKRLGDQGGEERNSNERSIPRSEDLGYRKRIMQKREGRYSGVQK